MAISPTRFSRLSIGWYSSDETLADHDAADTGPVASIDGPFSLGEGGTSLDGISATTAAIDFGSVAAHESSSVTAALSGAAVGDSVIASPGSNWSGAYYDLAINAHVSEAGVVTVSAANSTATAVNPDETVFRLTAINFSSFV